MPTATTLGTAASAVSGTTLALTVTANVAVGEQIFVATGIQLNVGTETMSVTDSGSNSYTKDKELQHPSSVPSGALHRAVCTTGLTSGSSTITLTVSAPVNERLVTAFKLAVGDVLVPIVTDGTNSNSGVASTAATPGSVTPTFNPDFAVMVTVDNGAALRTGTPPANWTEMADFGTSLQTGLQHNRLTALTSNNTALNGTETISAAADWVCMQVLYKGIVAAHANILVVDSAVALSTSR
jgi:hypothetical protein